MTEVESIPVTLLSPGELTLTIERLRRARNLVSNGEVDPVTIARIGDHWVVRDGNHRVRAWIEQHSGVIPDVACHVTTIENADLQQVLRWAAFYFGPGPNGFMQMIPVWETDRSSEDARITRIIRARETEATDQ